MSSGKPEDTDAKQEQTVQTYQPATSRDTSIKVDLSFKAPDELLQAQNLANLLDTAVKIPFIGIRVGLDFLVGLIPGVGDLIMLLASLRIVHLGQKMQLPNALKYKMVRNSLIDFALGFIPILGDIVDVFFKANQLNVRIMETWWVSQNKEQIDAIAKQQLDEWQQNQALNDN